MNYIQADKIYIHYSMCLRRCACFLGIAQLRDPGDGTILLLGPC